MPPSNEALAPAQRWSVWLRALWGERAELAWQAGGSTDRPVLTGRGGEAALHLPATLQERTALAACAHAAAHWRFGGEAQSRAGLKPVQQALFDVLEDARVEWLALQELPGLRALWLPFHAGAGAPGGNGFEALLARLARSLLASELADPHPWLDKARAGFFAPDGSTLRLRTPAQVRAAASRLGNDIGQMRLPFNAPTYRPHAAYRDDGSWLWLPEASAPDSDTTLAVRASEQPASAALEGNEAQGTTSVRYPEWDARIGRYRRDWCHVHARAAPIGDPCDAPLLAPGERFRVLRALAGLRGPKPQHAGRAAAGDEFHAGALVDAWVQRRARRTPDERVYRRRAWPAQGLAVQLLLDASASTAEAMPRGGTVLREMTAMALACAEALEALGQHCAIACFSSRGRQRVESCGLKEWDEPAGAPQVLARCAAQRAVGSTRLGAGVRHATAQAAAFARARGAARPMVLLLTDGDARDVDVPDPAYLLGDLRRAVADSEAAGVAVRCVQAGGLAGGARLRHALAGRAARLPAAAALPGMLVSLLAG